MTRALAAGLVAATVLWGTASCSEPETTQLLRVRFSDCSIAAEQVGELVFIVERADGLAFETLEEGTREKDGVEISGDDIDADGMLEWVLRVRRAEHDIRDGFALRMDAGEDLDRDLTVTVLAADDEARQIGALDGSPRLVQFRRNHERSVDLPITCLCLGMGGCGGTCEGAPDEGCRPAQDHETYCHDGLDNDADPLRDCADPDCYRQGPCAACDVEICDNGDDDDCDGAIDCGDDACAERRLCEEIPPEDCDNGGDDDRDSLADCLDPDCAEDDACSGACTVNTEICDNRRDDDCDHDVDCLDDDCATPDHEAVCDDGFDDDCDDRVDCSDPDCYDICGCDPEEDAEHLVEPEGCHDGLDNDCDGVFDCEDPDCDGALHEVCDNTVDDDCDGDYNCADSDCPGATLLEICDDLFDNDCDGLFDCEDPRCRVGAIELPGRCGDFLDNDCDEKVDCEDPDCSDLVVCRGTSH